MVENQIKVFENTDFGNARVIEHNGEPYFVGKEVAEILGYSNTRDALAKHVDDEDKATVAIHDGSQNRNQTVINESGLYSLIIGSKLPEAKKFKHWVTAEVLPTIRKTGGYGKNLSPQLQYLIVLETEQKAMRQDIDENTHRLEAIEKKLKADPKTTQRIKAEPKDWCEREKDYLRKAYALGQTDTEIAADMGRTVSSVRAKRYALDLTGGKDRSKKHWTKREDKRLMKLVDDGYATAEIARMLGRSIQSIQTRRARLRKETNL